MHWCPLKAVREFHEDIGVRKLLNKYHAFKFNLKVLLGKKILMCGVVFLLTAKVPGSEDYRPKRVGSFAPLLVRPVADVYAHRAHAHSLAIQKH